MFFELNPKERAAQLQRARDMRHQLLKMSRFLIVEGRTIIAAHQRDHREIPVAGIERAAERFDQAYLGSKNSL